MATNRIVSKKELEDSGASSLREFLNRERGLTMKAPTGTKFGQNVARPTASDRATMNAQDNANRGLDENGRPLQEQAYVGRNQYRESGHAAADKLDDQDRLDALNAAYKPRRSSAGAGRGGQGGMSSMEASRARAGTDGYDEAGNAMKRGGKVKKMASGGSVSSASSRADGIAQRGKTNCKIVMCGGGMARGRK
jgi:hypothetical protein